MDFYFNIITQILIFFLLFIGLKYLETFWYYPTPKPYVWLNAVKNKKVSKNLKSIESRYYDKIRFYIIWFQIERLRKENIEGDFAELGVHKGETAKLIYEMDTSRNLHLFDTFEGFPGYSQNDNFELFNDLYNKGRITKSHFNKVWVCFSSTLVLIVGET